MSYRERYKPLIARLISENQGLPERELRKILRDRFPNPPRAYHPYKIWLDEIRVQLGKKVPKVRKKGERLPVKPCEGQHELFAQ